MKGERVPEMEVLRLQGMERLETPPKMSQEMPDQVQQSVEEFHVLRRCDGSELMEDLRWRRASLCSVMQECDTGEAERRRRMENKGMVL